MNKLLIDKQKEFKITKVKLWAVYFTYDGERYLLHDMGDLYEEILTLYHRGLNKHGNYTLTPIHSSYDEMPHIEYYTKHGNTYNQINIVKFIDDMIEMGFMDIVNG